MYNVLDYLLLKFNPEKLLIDFPWVLNVCFYIALLLFQICAVTIIFIKDTTTTTILQLPAEIKCYTYNILEKARF
jgi:hypothetical protein